MILNWRSNFKPALCCNIQAKEEWANRTACLREPMFQVDSLIVLDLGGCRRGAFFLIPVGSLARRRETSIAAVLVCAALRLDCAESLLVSGSARRGRVWSPTLCCSVEHQRLRG